MLVQHFSTFFVIFQICSTYYDGLPMEESVVLICVVVVVIVWGRGKGGISFAMAKKQQMN